MTDPFSRGAHLRGQPAGDAQFNTDACPYAMWDAAYVLGSLSSTERREYEGHLPLCRHCCAAVTEFGGVPALLGMLRPDEVAAIDDGGLEPPPLRPQLLDELLGKVRTRRGRMRWMVWTLSTAAAAVLAVGVFVAIRQGPVAPTPTAQPPTSITAMSMTPVAPSSLEATVSVTAEGWGTSVAMRCTYRPETGAGDDEEAGDELAMFAVSRQGERIQLATWMAHEGVTATPTGSTSMPIDDIAAVQIASVDTGTVLLQRGL